MSSAVAMAFSQYFDLRPATDREGARQRSASLPERHQAVGKGKCDALHHRLGELRPAGFLADASERSADQRVVVGRALA